MNKTYFFLNKAYCFLIAKRSILLRVHVRSAEIYDQIILLSQNFFQGKFLFFFCLKCVHFICYWALLVVRWGSAPRGGRSPPVHVFQAQVERGFFFPGPSLTQAQNDKRWTSSPLVSSTLLQYRAKRRWSRRRFRRSLSSLAAGKAPESEEDWWITVRLYID
jgi:hypothetical protein